MNLWMVVERDQRSSIGPFLTGRMVVTGAETIEVVYPTRDYYGETKKLLDESILREVSTLQVFSQTDSPYFPEEYSMTKCNDALVINFERTGTPLRALMNKKELLAEHGINIMKMVVDALSYMHKKGYAHRGLTPENILISDDYKNLKLIGFNQTHHWERDISQFPPESLPYSHNKDKHWGVASPRWDFRAAGTIFFEMM